ncbi:MAG: LVIVD repeat-containing protein, partial [Methanoregula sp.]
MSCRPFSACLILPVLLFLLVLFIVPVTSASAPTVTGITPSSGPNTTSVSITDLAGTGFQSGANITLTPVNVTPVHKGSIADSAGGAKLSNPYSVYVAGNYAYVASADSNALEIVDISNPASPTHKASIANGVGGALLTSPHSVYVSGNYAYVASYGSNALEIVNITDPTSPTHKGKILNGDGGANLIGPYG